ncbi:unnamed protein product [Phaedon cochleariae]|uniref:C2H2-type domain-containing protein n=1 Tax=Phaedon cochleariae TaxID=80249 RepID=A0A9P0GM63_PHACE|nr:unnamed protein product [Phaedon cochleariae]
MWYFPQGHLFVVGVRSVPHDPPCMQNELFFTWLISLLKIEDCNLRKSKDMQGGSIRFRNGYFPCGICGATLTRLDNLRRHQKTVCAGLVPIFQCELCPFVSKHKYNLRMHVKSSEFNDFKNSPLDLDCDEFLVKTEQADGNDELSEKGYSDETVGRRREFSSSERAAQKRRKSSGQEYMTTRGIIRPARTIRTSCTNCRLRCNEMLDDQARHAIFDSFWGLGDTQLQWNYIASRVHRHPKKSCSGLSSRRKFSHNYTFVQSGQVITVCKKFFFSTLNITDRMVRTALDSDESDERVTE